MPTEKTLVSRLYDRLDGKVVIAAEVNDEDIVGIGTEELSAMVISFFKDDQGIKILDKTALEKIRSAITVKEPVEVIVEQASSFKPLAKEYDADYRIINTAAEK